MIICAQTTCQKKPLCILLQQGNVIIIDKVVQGKMRLKQLWISAKENDRAKNVLDNKFSPTCMFSLIKYETHMGFRFHHQ